MPCECCPQEVVQLGGDVLIAFRNNDNNDRYMWVATAPKAGAFSVWKAGSTTEGLVLDPVYTGKALAGLMAALKAGRIGGTIVFWHTGGSIALFADEFASF